MGTGVVLVVVMTGFVVLLIAKTRVPANDEERMFVYSRDQMLRTETRSGGWAFVVILLAALFLAIVLVG